MIPEAGIVLDAGTAMFRVRDLLRIDTLDLFLSHAHLDHVCGLTYLLGILYQKQMSRVTVHGAPEKLSAIEERLFTAPIFPVAPPFEFKPLEKLVPLANGGVLTHVPLGHPGGSVGYRLDWPGHSLAYITDTTAAEDAGYREFVHGVNVLVHECNFTDSDCDLAILTGHSCTSDVARLAKAAGVDRLILTHVNPMAPEADPVDLATAQAIFPATSLAADEMTIDF
jgi:ribonuclease BN (tRNA processing enzyme)